MSLGDGFHFAYICILPPQIKLGKYANAEAQVMAEVFIVITSGSSTLQRLHRTGVTATSGGLGAGREVRVAAKGVGVGKASVSRAAAAQFLRLHRDSLLQQNLKHQKKNNLTIHHHTLLTVLITKFFPSALDVPALKCIVSQ